MNNDRLNKTILLVEDEAIIAMAVSSILKGFGYDVITVHHGEIAVETAMEHNEISLILMDIDLGSGIDGTETARRILAARAIPIIFLTSHSEQEMVDKVRGITRYGYLIKSSGDFVIQSSIELAFELFETTLKLEKSEKQLRSLTYVVEQSPVSIVITDTDGNIQYANPASEQTTGYPAEELVGKNPRVLKSDYIKAEEYKELWKTITSGKYWKGQFHNIRKDGSYYWEAATISPIFDEDGNIERYAAVKEDITERKAAEEKIQNLLREKELLLAEVHHRIKNNMNTIKGLLFLQGADLEDPAAAAALHDAESRVQSMMILYDKLYCSHDFREISVKSYLGPLVDEIIENFPNRGIVTVVKDIGDFVLDAKIVFPLGIIVNELITNIMKYAFTGRESGLIGISASISDNQVEIIVKDDGNGMPESVNIEKSTGFGLNLIGMLTSQIGGNIRIERGSGAAVILEFTSV